MKYEMQKAKAIYQVKREKDGFVLGSISCASFYIHGIKEKEEMVKKRV
jgi:hypothetical protein